MKRVMELNSLSTPNSETGRDRTWEQTFHPTVKRDNNQGAETATNSETGITWETGTSSAQKENTLRTESTLRNMPPSHPRRVALCATCLPLTLGESVTYPACLPTHHGRVLHTQHASLPTHHGRVIHTQNASLPTKGGSREPL